MIAEADKGQHAVADRDDDLAAKIADQRGVDFGQNGDDFIPQGASGASGTNSCQCLEMRSWSARK